MPYTQTSSISSVIEKVRKFLTKDHGYNSLTINLLDDGLIQVEWN